MVDDKKKKNKIIEFFKTIGTVLVIILLIAVIIGSLIGIVVLFTERTREFNKDIYGKEKKKRKGKKNVKRKI